MAGSIVETAYLSTRGGHKTAATVDNAVTDVIVVVRAVAADV